MSLAFHITLSLAEITNYLGMHFAE